MWTVGWVAFPTDPHSEPRIIYALVYLARRYTYLLHHISSKNSMCVIAVTVPSVTPAAGNQKWHFKKRFSTFTFGYLDFRPHFGGMNSH